MVIIMTDVKRENEGILLEFATGLKEYCENQKCQDCKFRIVSNVRYLLYDCAIGKPAITWQLNMVKR